MKSKYTYFVSYTWQDNNGAILNGRTDYILSHRILTENDISLIEDKVHGALPEPQTSDSVIINNFILLSEEHEPEKSDNKKEFLTELHELFTKYDAQIEGDSCSNDLSIFIGKIDAITVNNSIIDTDDIASELLN